VAKKWKTVAKSANLLAKKKCIMSKVSVAKAMEALVMCLRKVHAMVQGQAKW
jgi:hypothetical protein